MAAIRALKTENLRSGADPAGKPNRSPIGGLLETTMIIVEIRPQMGEKSDIWSSMIEAPSDNKPSVQHLVFSASLGEGKQLIFENKSPASCPKGFFVTGQLSYCHKNSRHVLQFSITLPAFIFKSK